MDEQWNRDEKELKKLEERLRREYAQATKEAQEALDEYLRAFRRKDAEWKAKVEAGEVSETEYRNWRRGQIAVGKRWEAMKDVLAHDMLNANDIARGMIYDSVIETYASNYNYGVFEIENGLSVNTNLVLYDQHAVRTLVTKDPYLLPMPSPKRLRELQAAKEMLWTKQQVQSVALQAILQGESIPQIANRISETLGESNYHAAVRNARTISTAAANMGRTDAYIRGEEMGIEGVREWVAVHDGRTRHEHREADGQQVGAKEPFIVGGFEMRCPGDPSAPGRLVYNCRCGIKYIPKGFTPTAKLERVIRGYSSYEEWKHGKSIYEQRKKG